MRAPAVLLLLAATLAAGEPEPSPTWILTRGLYRGAWWVRTDGKEVRADERRAGQHGPLWGTAWLETRQGAGGGVYLHEGEAARRLATQTHSARDASWSADGKRFLYSGQAGRYWQLFLGEVKEEPVEARQLTRDELDAVGGRLSPDGKRVAYLEQPKPQRFTKIVPGRPVVLSLADGARQVLHEGGYFLELAWSPDGRSIAASSTEALEIYDLPTGKVTKRFVCRDLDEELYAHAAHGLCWSPDGQELACRITFLGGREAGTEVAGDKDLFFLPLQGAVRRVVPDVPSDNWIPVRWYNAKELLPPPPR